MSMGKSYTFMRLEKTPATDVVAVIHLASGPGAPGGDDSKGGYPYSTVHSAAL